MRRLKIGEKFTYKCKSCELIKRYAKRILLQCGDTKVIKTNENVIKDFNK